MAVSKRLRFEVLRRDQFRCKYCGIPSQDGAELTVDHVVPRALGGSDDPGNLVAACRDCNAGKSATNPDAPLVAAVDDKAAEWSLAMNRVIEQRAAELEADRKRIRRFDRKWKAWTGSAGAGMPRDANWKNSVSRFFAAGLDDEFVADAIATAVGKNHIPARDKWRYFCGICWHEIDDLLRRTGAEVAGQKPVAAPSRDDGAFDYMSAFKVFSEALVQALGGTEDVEFYVDGLLYDVMPEVHAEWLKQRAELDSDAASELVMDEMGMRVANGMYHLGEWRKLRDDFAKRFLGIALMHGGVPDSAIEIAQRCFVPAVDGAVKNYAARIKKVHEPEGHTLSCVETDMHIMVMDAMLELGEQAEAIP